MRVTVGRIGKPHGIRGEVTVESMTDEPDLRFAPGSILDRAQGGSLEVSSMRWHSGTILIKFAGCDDRNAAELLRGTLLEIDRDVTDSPSDPSEFYDSQLIGCQVFTMTDELVGAVIEVLHLPSQDLLAVESAGQEVLIPFVSDIVPSVDTVSKKIVIDPPDGLLNVGSDESIQGD